MLPPWFRRPAPCLRLLPAAALAGWLLCASAAQAECVPDPAVMGDTVTCTAADADGFDAGAVNDLTVNVDAGATVDNADAAGVSAIRVNDDNEITINSGAALSADGAGSDGLTGGARNTVTHSGTITVGGSGAGIRMGDEAMVTTQPGSLIRITGDGGVGIELGNVGFLRNRGNIDNGAGTPMNSVGIRLGTGNGGFEVPGSDPMDPTFFPVNSGTIGLTGPGAIGIDADADNVFENSGIIRTTGTGAIGVRLGTGNTFTNSNRITVDGDMVRGIVSTGTGNSIVNLFRIEVDADATNALAIQGSAGDEALDNLGTIVGDVQLGAGSDTVTLFSGSQIQDGVYDGGNDSDPLRLRGSGLGNLDLDTVTGFESLDVSTEGSAAPGTWALSGTMPASFGGGVTLDRATLSLDDLVVLTTPTYAQTADGVLQIVIDPVAATAGHLHLSGGAATLAAGTTLGVLQSTPILGDLTIPVLTADLGIAGTFDNIPADTAVLQFDLIETATEIQLAILRSSYALVGQTPNQEAVGSYLDELLLGSPSPLLAATLVLLDGLQAGELAAALDQLHPESYDTHTGALAAVGRTLAGIAARERLWCKPPLSELGGGRYQEEPCGRAGFSVWLDAVTGVHDRDTGSDWLESDGSTQALVAGVDWRPDRRVVVSGWAGLSSVDLDVDDDSEGDIETYEFGISTLARVSGARARVSFGYGRGNHEHDRPIPFLEATARGEYDSNRVLGLLDLGWLFELGGFSIEPQAALDVTWIQEETLDEEGAGDLGLSLDERTNTLVSTAFGARLAYRHVQRAYVDPGPSWTQGVWTPEITGRWRSTWTGADREIDAHLLGDPTGGFTTEARDTEQGAEVGARLTFHPHGGGGSVSVGYDGYFGDGGTAHRAGIELRLHV